MSEPVAPSSMEEIEDLRSLSLLLSARPLRVEKRDGEARLVLDSDNGTFAWSGHGSRVKAENYAALICVTVNAMPGLLALLDVTMARLDAQERTR